MKARAALIVFLVVLAIVAFYAVLLHLTSIPVEKDKIGIIDLSGEIVSGEDSPVAVTTGEIERAFENARRDNRVKAVVLSVDSPGGEASACYMMYSTVRRFGKPVVAFIKGSGASGAYLVSLGATSIMAHPFSRVGSIGAYIQLAKPVPVQPENATEIYTITSGKLKDIWADGVLDENEREYLKMKVDETKRSFFNLVFQRTKIRSSDLERAENNIRDPLYQLAEGGWFSGEEALKLGLIDALGDLVDALRLASTLAGIELEKAEVVSVMPPPPGTFSNMFYETSFYRDNTALPIFLK